MYAQRNVGRTFPSAIALCVFSFSFLSPSLSPSFNLFCWREERGEWGKGSRTVYGKYIWPVKKELERERGKGITADFGGNPNDSARKFRRT